MRTVRLRVTVPDSRDRRVTLCIPDDVPPGEAEVILVSADACPASKLSAREETDERFARRFPRDPLLGPIRFHEDPTAGVAPGDWPEDQRP